MKTRFLFAGIVAVFGILGFMLYVDLNYCYQNIFPSDDLLFAICSNVFGIEGLIYTIVSSFSALLQIQLADVAPCFNKELNQHVPCSPDDSIQFYEYKGEEWMEAKKQELFATIKNNTLHEWVDLTKEDHSHWNVYMYYSATGELEELTKDLETEPDIWDYENDEWKEEENEN